MARWLVGLVLGLAALGGVFFLWKRESAPTAEVAAAPGESMTAPSAPPSSGAGGEAGSGTDAQEPVAEAGGAAPPEPAAAPAPDNPNASAEGVISVDEPWANEAAPGRDSTAVYMLLTNTSQTADRIASVSSPDAAEAAVLDTRIDAKNAATTAPATHVDLDPGIPLVFEPGGLHVMLVGLKHPIKPGDMLTVVLVFQHAGTLRVKVPVGEQQTDGDSVQP